MPISNIVTIVLRLFAIQMLVQALSLALEVTASFALRGGSSRNYFNYLTPAALLVLAVLEWLLAPGISRLVTRNHNSELSTGGLSREDIYAFAFVFLGLYFILVSIAPSLNWLHYLFSVEGRSTGQTAEGRKSFYDLASHLITLIAGFMSLLPANRWARRLVNSERRNDAP